MSSLRFPTQLRWNTRGDIIFRGVSCQICWQHLNTVFVPIDQRLNMELDLHSLFGPHMQAVLIVSLHNETLQHPHPPFAFGLAYRGAIGQPRLKTSLCDPLPLTVGIFKGWSEVPNILCRAANMFSKIYERLFKGWGEKVKFVCGPRICFAC